MCVSGVSQCLLARVFGTHNMMTHGWMDPRRMRLDFMREGDVGAAVYYFPTREFRVEVLRTRLHTRRWLRRQLSEGDGGIRL